MESPNGLLWDAGLAIARALDSAGFEAYLVGGCVRDRLLGRELNDVDIATSAKPEDVAGLFERTLPTGLKHGTVTVMEGGRSFEVTTFRLESGYTDGRRPDEVAFVKDIREDLSRRDFTFNAMAFGLDGVLVDPFGGRDDLRAGVVRCVGEAGSRFGEDALRMLRAIRFSAEFGFVLADSTVEGIAARKTRLSQVAMERVGAEWDKMMAGNGPDRAAKALQESGLLAHLKEPLPAPLLRSRQFSSLRLNEIRDADLRWAAYLSEYGLSDDEIRRIGRALRFGGRRTERIANGAGVASRMARSEERANWIDAVLDYGSEAAKDWLQIGAETGTPRPSHEAWLAALPASTVAGLAVKGDELSRSLGEPPGPWIAELLNALLRDTAHGRVRNEKKELLDRAAESFRDNRYTRKRDMP